MAMSEKTKELVRSLLKEADTAQFEARRIQEANALLTPEDRATHKHYKRIVSSNSSFAVALLAAAEKGIELF